MVTIDEFFESDNPLSLDPNFDGSCPCANIEVDDVKIEMHCWRVACDYGCKYSGIHVQGPGHPYFLSKMAEHVVKNTGWSEGYDITTIVIDQVKHNVFTVDYWR